jgi:uncharacterized membrane protein YeaQ/YmgE (transglycosylase-associated protein family)
MDFFVTIDFIICLIVGAIVGLLAGQVMKGRGPGLIGNIVVGLVGGVAGGWVFDVLDFMNLGDVLDPIIAGVVGAVVLLAIAGAIRR